MEAMVTESTTNSMQIAKIKTKRATVRSRLQDGFTLVEVIVVLVILAILAAIFVPSLIGWINKADKKSLVSECRSAVLAAQTLYTEHYKDGRTVGEADIKSLAEIDGTVSNIEADKATVVHLSYTKDPYTVTFCRHPATCTQGHKETYNFEEGTSAASWESGKVYKVGDVMQSGGYIFKCVRAHTSGSDSATRDPASGAGNKTTWHIIGYVDGVTKNYSSTFRYEAGVEVIYNGKRYIRKDYLLNGGATPSDNSQYWTLKQ